MKHFRLPPFKKEGWGGFNLYYSYKIPPQSPFEKGESNYINSICLISALVGQQWDRPQLM